jgi:hypothetical protein
MWFESTRLHLHRWRDTRINPFGITTEQRCSCGAARHAFDPADVLPIDAPIKWREGPHPYSAGPNFGGNRP